MSAPLNRRQFLQWMGIAGLGVVGGCRYWPEDGLWNDCPEERLPKALREHDVVLAAWEGLDPKRVWDSHAHLIGVGDSDSGIWVNPSMRSLFHPIQFTQFKFYLNASCAAGEQGIDRGYVERLRHLHQDFKAGSKLMLLAFEYRYDENGQRQQSLSPFHVPNDYTAKIAQQHPEAFEWIASIHPYREDCLDALDRAVAAGARAVKWLPGAMGIDPSSPRCDRFYGGLNKHDLPLLTHAGSEHAVDTADTAHFNNPLLLRRPLAQGVRVIVAHCASIGESQDIEQGEPGPERANFDLFARLMAVPEYEGQLFGDISALTQVNRDIEVISQIVQRRDWHHRLINGSDYPLPGVMPVFSVSRYVDEGFITAQEAKVLSAIRYHNPLLFDFVLKRTLRVAGVALSGELFESQRVFI